MTSSSGVRDVGAGDEPCVPETGSGDRYIAVVGIDCYAAWPKLQRAVSDARGARDTFIRLGFKEPRPPLFDEAATGDALRRLVADDLRALGKDDSLVVFFAGHGHTVTTTYDGGASAKRGYLVPADATPPGSNVSGLVSLDNWLHDLAHLPPKHILVVIDACHSGIALNQIIRWRGEDVRSAEPLAKLRARRSRRIITSALDNELAMDNGPIEGHSLFTGCLLEALSGGLKARTGYPVATGSELALHVQRRVSSYPSSRQTPDFGALELDDRGELIFDLSDPSAIMQRRGVDTILPKRRHGSSGDASESTRPSGDTVRTRASFAPSGVDSIQPRRAKTDPAATTPVSGAAAGDASAGNGATGNGQGTGKRGTKARRDTRPGDGESPINGHAASSQLLVGTASTFGAEQRTIEISSLLRHTGILGSSGSGKTTLALNLIEQLLERGVAVVLVDRKGDLAGYARPDWWKQAADPERARRLADRLDVRLFTPGTRGGRPLSLSVVPDLQQIPDHERDRMVQYSANALAAMMNLGSGAADNACRAILTQAIAVLAERNKPCGLPELLDLLESRDDQLLARAGRYDDKRFKKLVEDLETVRLNDADLFDSAAESLTAETLIGRQPGGKVPLAIASTRFLGDVERVQSWVAHLIACLNRYAAKSPSSELRLVFMIDEADVFMPAGSVKPPSKEPLQDLLKRARAAGLGVVLASQSPADFDYRSREQINTWFLGRIADQRSIDKMKPLFEHRPAVGGKLGSQDPGRFVMLQDGGAVDLGRTPSLLRTEQIPEAELMALAARTKDHG